MPFENPENERRFLLSLGRAFGGALFFAFPLIMTMEMWQLGIYLERWRLALFLVVLVPVLIGLSYYSGFRETLDWKEDFLDAMVAFAIGLILSALFLSLFAVFDQHISPDQIIGQLVLLSIPASMGAVLASKQFGVTDEENVAAHARASYPGELFIMGAGALFLAFNVAPTEEMILIAYKMSAWHGLALVLVTVIIMHVFVYAVNFRGQESAPSGRSPWRVFSHFTAAGYLIALLVSVFVLWSFGRLDNLGPATTLMTIVVMSFPAGLGAALSRLVI